MSIINEYIWPSLIYPLHCAPLTKIKSKFLNDVDKILRSSAKEIIGLPHDSPNNMLYAPKKFRGIGLMKAGWEAYIQHLNICKTLSKSPNEHLHYVRNFELEKQTALSALDISPNDIPENSSARQIRKILRFQEFQNWTSLSVRGKGVQVFAECPKLNNWVSRRNALSVSEWTNALKMSCNTSAVRAVPGRSLDTNRCRHNGCSEIETLPHVLGFCAKGELLRNTRHHRVRSALASSLLSRNWDVYQEVHCISTCGSNRRADIIAINKKHHKAYILDPTVRFEKDSQQAIEVDLEKRALYEPCIQYFSSHYQIPLENWKVYGLLFGARGGLTSYTFDLLKEFNFTTEFVRRVVQDIIKDSLRILHHHMYF